MSERSHAGVVTAIAVAQVVVSAAVTGPACFIAVFLYGTAIGIGLERTRITPSLGFVVGAAVLLWLSWGLLSGRVERWPKLVYVRLGAGLGALLSVLALLALFVRFQR